MEQEVSVIHGDERRRCQCCPTQPFTEVALQQLVESLSEKWNNVTRLALAITRKPGDAEAFIKLGTQLPVRDGWIELGDVEIAAK